MNPPPTPEAMIRHVEIGKKSPDAHNYLFIHGLGGSLEQWSKIMRRVGRESHAIAVDVPGFGQSRTLRGRFDVESSVEELRHFCGQNDVRSCVLVSHSIGCVIAARLATLEPDRFTRLVMVSGALVRASEMAQHPSQMVSKPRLGGLVATQFLAGMFPIPGWLLRTMARSPNFRSMALWPFVAHPRALAPAALIETLTGTGSFAVARILLTAKSIRYREILGGVPQPIDLVVGNKDRLINGDDLSMLQEIVRLRSTHTIEDCGHWPWVETPGQLTQILVDLETA